MADLSQIPDLQGVTNNQRTAGNALLGNQASQTGDFLKQYQGVINGLPSTASLASSIGDQLNLPQLRQTASQLNQRVLATPMNNLNATQGSETNNNQLSKMNAYDLGKIEPLAQNATTQQQTAENILTQQLGYNQADRQLQLLPIQAQQGLMSDAFARQTSMFSQENQAELDGLIAKMNAGVTLTTDEADNANRLAVAEKNYQAQLQQQQNQQQFQKDLIPYQSSYSLANSLAGINAANAGQLNNSKALVDYNQNLNANNLQQILGGNSANTGLTVNSPGSGW